MRSFVAKRLGVLLLSGAHSNSASFVQTRHAKAATGAMPNKTDRNDLRTIAQIVRTGWCRAVHVKNPRVSVQARAADRATDGAQ